MSSFFAVEIYDAKLFIVKKKSSYWIYSLDDKELKPLPISKFWPVSHIFFNGNYIHFTKVGFNSLERHLYLVDLSTRKEAVHIKRPFGEHIIDYSISSTGQKIFLLTCNFPPWDFKKVSGKARYHFSIRIYNFAGKELKTLPLPASMNKQITRIEASSDGKICIIKS